MVLKSNFQNLGRLKMHKEFYYRLDIALNAIIRKGKELAQTEEQLQEWLKDYLVMLTEIEKYTLDLKDIWEDPKADEVLERLEKIANLDNLREMEDAIKALRDELAPLYEKYLEEVIASKRRK
jgi:DNA repair ATPase RecN